MPTITSLGGLPLVDAASGDFHPAAGSPTIDAGTNQYAPADDFDGVARPVGGALWILDPMNITEFQSRPQRLLQRM